MLYTVYMRDVGLGAWVPSCLSRECQRAEMFAVTINGCCSHLVPLFDLLYYHLVVGIALLKPTSFFEPPPSRPPTPYIWCTSEITFLKWREIF